MLETREQGSACKADTAPKREPASVVEVLMECAWEAVVLAFLVRLFGSIALGMVGGIFSEMTPSAPPEVGKPLLENDPNAPQHLPHFLQFRFPSHFPFGAVRGHSFLLLAGVFFVLKSARRLAHRGESEGQPERTSRVRKIAENLGENWFYLIVGNAFGAFATVMALQFTQQFSTTHFIWETMSSALRPVWQALAGASGQSVFVNQAGALWDWYNQNQSKFMFWFFYTASICDDLGVPNFKSLGRYTWRRVRKRRRA